MRSEQLKREVRTLIHALVNCQQAILGYYELGEYRKAHTMSLECRSELDNLATKLAELDADSVES